MPRVAPAHCLHDDVANRQHPEDTRYTAMCVPGELPDGAGSTWFVYDLQARGSAKVGAGVAAQELAARTARIASDGRSQQPPAVRRNADVRDGWVPSGSESAIWIGVLTPNVLLTRFVITRPAYEIEQAASLAWLAAAHTEAEAARAGGGFDRDAFATKIGHAIERVACGPDRIARRGYSVADIGSHAGWTGNELYDLPVHPHGSGSAARTQLYAGTVDRYFAATYADEVRPPDDLIHVTCTGYASPSGAQKLVATRLWPTRVTHAYHMGCYAAIPAVRLAAGAIAMASGRADVAHTELCTLHLDPADHSLEQLVVQSLFADGMIRYSMVPGDGGPGLRLRALHEQVLPDSADAMGWVVSNWGMHMTLARDVPERVAGAARGFVVELYRRAGLDIAAIPDSIFAVHPGGPRIIDRVRDVLELSDAQVQASRDVLRAYGNMSSATLPHIWHRLLGDPAVPRGTMIPSLAFGPGLTMCGALLEKR